MLTPMVVPSRWTEAKGIGSPFEESVTLPDTEMFCANATEDIRTATEMQIIRWIVSILIMFIKFVGDSQSTYCATNQEVGSFTGAGLSSIFM